MEEVEFKCVVCDKSFSSRYSLTNHYANHTPRIRFHVCDICNKGFYYKGRLNSHMKAHNSKKPFVCCICKKSFKDERVYKRHCSMHSKNSNNPYSCEECGKTFTEKLIFEVHQLTHPAKTTFRCEVCGKMFFEKPAFLKHKDGHSLVLFKCRSCLKEFNSSTKLKQHEDTHKPRTCSLCSEVFPDEDAYFNHWVVHENENTFASVSNCDECKYCHEEFETQEILEDHIQDQHKYWCCVCSIDFQTVVSYKKHLNIHTNEGFLEQNKMMEPKKFICTICNRECPSQIRLDRHLAGHDANKPFSCEICGKFFDDENIMKTHQALHVRKERMKCEICGKEFTERLFYNIHQLTHIEQKPICCDICEDVFTERGAFLRHRKNHKSREVKDAQRFVTMREMLKQKLEDSEKSPDDATEPEMILGNIDETGGSQIKTGPYTTILDPSKLFHCDFCGKLFEEEKVMKEHQDGHIKKKHQICDICGDIFTENYLFLRHRNSHRRRADKESKKGKLKRKLEDEMLVEDYCESNNHENDKIQIKIEKDDSVEEIHRSEHVQKNLIICSICGKEFKETVYYDIHQLSHLDKKPIRCEICGDIFTEEYLFSRHKSLHKQAKRINNMRELLKQKLVSQ